MTIEEFINVSEMIPNFYDGKGRLNPFQIDIWFEELKGYSAEKYKRALKIIFKNSQYVPGLSKVLETIRTVKENEEDKPKVECKLCRGSGYIIQQRTVDGVVYPYALKCNCQNANGLDYDGTKISDKEHRSKFYLETAEKYYSDLAAEKTKELKDDGEYTDGRQISIQS